VRRVPGNAVGWLLLGHDNHLPYTTGRLAGQHAKTLRTL
jgi:hypothetical protein